MSKSLFASTISVLVASTLLNACAGPGIEALMPTPVIYTEINRSPLDHIPEAQRWKPRRVYYATTRQREQNLTRINYTNEEAEHVAVGMSLIGFGGPHISWSDLSRYSRLEKRPEVVDLSIAGLVEAGYFVPGSELGSVQDVGGATAWLLADLNNAIATARDQDLLIYVHGAKVDFYNANVFAAQLDHFMGRDMASMAFSWPTRQNIIAYGSGGDVRRAYTAADSFASLLALLARDSKAHRIHIVAWSAGGRVVNAALRKLHDEHRGAADSLAGKYRIGTVYFAASDVPGDEFLEALPALDSLAQRVVVTVSSNDGALRMAERFMGGGTRIGQAGIVLSGEELERVLDMRHLEVINVSEGWEGRGFDITGHRYWISHPWASSDMLLAVRSDLSPGERGLAATDLPILWTIPPDYPARLRRLITTTPAQIRKHQGDAATR
jgi:esterase/lipase superfamily enzyme